MSIRYCVCVCVRERPGEKGVCVCAADHQCLIYTCRYESPEVALNCGMMLRECLRHEPLARTVLFSEDFFCFFRYVELSTFDIASDAFASFKVRSPVSLLFLFRERLFDTPDTLFRCLT